MAKKPLPAAATKTTAAPAKPAPAVSRGRGPNLENQSRLDTILARTKAEPGVESRVLADELGITTLQCSQLTDRLVRSGEIEIFKKANGVRTNWLPKDLAKNLPKLQKQFDADVAAKAANATDDKTAKFAKLKADKAAKAAAAKEAAPAADAAAKAPRKRKTAAA